MEFALEVSAASCLRIAWTIETLGAAEGNERTKRSPWIVEWSWTVVVSLSICIQEPSSAEPINFSKWSGDSWYRGLRNVPSDAKEEIEQVHKRDARMKNSGCAPSLFPETSGSYLSETCIRGLRGEQLCVSWERDKMCRAWAWPGYAGMIMTSSDYL